MASTLGNSFSPTQEFVPIKEVRDGVVLLKDGSMRAILMTSSINFALKSEEEQIAILVQFQNFLNSLEFSIQIFVQINCRKNQTIPEHGDKIGFGQISKGQTLDLRRFRRNNTKVRNKKAEKNYLRFK